MTACARTAARALLLGFIPVALAACTACAPLTRVDYGQLVLSGRDGFQLPEQVIESLDLHPGDRVAEIGAGDGYWLPWLSQAVGAEGVVYAVEVDDEKVAALEARVSREALANVVVVRGRFEDPELPDGEIDLAMTCLTYHHIEERPDYFRRLRVDLADGGRVAHLDDRDDVRPPIPFRWLQGSGHWSNPGEIRAEMSQAGYRHVASFDFLPVQSFQVFTPDPDPIAPAVQDARR
jgi:ubiquinone/menaquinone biosynthesis C-methylase UbiE